MSIKANNYTIPINVIRCTCDVLKYEYITYSVYWLVSNLI